MKDTNKQLRLIISKKKVAELEALLFVAGDPLKYQIIKETLEVSAAELEDLVIYLQQKYEEDEASGFYLRKINDSLVLATKAHLQDVLVSLFHPRHRPVFSQAAYETLAIILYNKQCTRSEVEAVRGVNSDNIITKLLERDFIVEAGHRDLPGKPAFFSVSDKFLKEFGLENAEALPPVDLLMYSSVQALAQQTKGEEEDII